MNLIESTLQWITGGNRVLHQFKTLKAHCCLTISELRKLYNKYDTEKYGICATGTTKQSLTIQAIVE